MKPQYCLYFIQGFAIVSHLSTPVTVGVNFRVVKGIKDIL